MSGPGLARGAVWLLLLPLVPALAAALWHPRRPDWEALRQAAALAPTAAHSGGLRIELAQARSVHPGVLWVDARPTRDFAAGHIPGAISLHEGAWDEGFLRLVEAWDGAASIVVYCGGADCRASEAVALRLRRELDTERVYALAGGWEAWQAVQGAAEGAAR